MIRKFITGIAVAGLLLAPAAAFADDSVVNANGPIAGTIMEPWGLTAGATPIAPEGSVIVDQYGFSVPCLYTVGCYDLTRTAWYVSYMLNVGRQLKAFGISGGPFAGWINAAQ